MVASKRWIVIGAAIAVLGLSACSKSSSSGTGASPAAPADGGTIQLAGETANYHGTVNVSAEAGSDVQPTVDISMNDYYYSPTVIKGDPGETVTVQLSNVTSNEHTFTIDGGVDRTVKPGDGDTVTVTIPETGGVIFFCKFHGSSGMRGAIGDPSGPMAPAEGGGGQSPASDSGGGNTGSGGSSRYGY